MRLAPLSQPAFIAILAASIPICVTLLAQVPDVPEPECDICGARGVGRHFHWCDYAPRPNNSPTYDPAPGPWIPNPPPESPFDRDKRELLNRLSQGTPTSESFTDFRSLMSIGPSSPPSTVQAKLESFTRRITYHDDPEVAAAAGELALMAPNTVTQLKQAIEQRRAERSADVQAVIKSIKTKAPPKLPGQFDNLRVGDVLLVHQPDDMLSTDFYIRGWIIVIDKTMSRSLRPRAYHTFLFVKEVNGVKLFLDNMPGEGTLVKSEAQILSQYGLYDFDVARPLGEFDAADLWKAAREAGIRSAEALKDRSSNLIDSTDYGFIGNDDMVCSETSRWALVKAGVMIPETRSTLKRWGLRIVYGPADFYLDTDHFLVSPLSLLRSGQNKHSPGK